MKWRVTLERFRDKNDMLDDEFPSARYTVVSYDGPLGAIDMLRQKISDSSLATNSERLKEPVFPPIEDRLEFATKELRDIAEHSVAPFTTAKWFNYVHTVASNALKVLGGSLSWKDRGQL